MFLSGATNIVVGSSETYILDRDELAATLTDEYLQDKSFWKEVLVQFREQSGTQRVVLSYTTNDTDQFVLSSQAKSGTWVLENVVIIDSDHGKEIIHGPDLPDFNLYNVTVTVS